jgi:uncharacterized protein YjdB
MNLMTEQNRLMRSRLGTLQLLWIVLAAMMVAFLIVFYPLRTQAAGAGQNAAATQENVNETKAEQETLAAAPGPSVEYQAHIQNIGWQKAVRDQAVAGTSGQGLRMEALKIHLLNNTYGGGLQYRAHVENIGWQETKADGQEAGTDGKALRIEALQISLTGEIANHFNIYYRVHAQKVGWMGWAMNGQSAGTQGYSLRLEAIQICLVSKGQPAPGSTEGAFRHQMIQASAHVQKIGWMAKVNEDTVAGTTGRGYRLEAFRLNLTNPDHYGNIQYQAYIRGKGWQNTASNGQVSGTTGQSCPIEAVRLSLTGEISQYYDIWYQVHISNRGWMASVKNGQQTGITDCGLHMEAMRFALVPKNGATPQWQVDNAKTFEHALISYQAHVQHVGWMSPVTDGQTAGTTGRALRAEAFKVNLIQPGYGGSVQYQAFVENIGWQNSWYQDGQTAGTTGKNLRLEGFRMKLTGDLATHYDIYYRAHVSNIGWLGWAKNGEAAGSRDLSLRIEAFQVQLVSKGENAPGSTSNAYLQCGLHYSVYQGGWQAEVTSGGTAGDTNSSSPVQGLKVSLADSSISGSIQYRSHVSNVGWETNWTSDGNPDGYLGRQNTEAIEMRLTGNMASYFDLYYSVNVRSRGWLGWAKNGESAGSKGFSLPIEAVRIAIVYKGNVAPGSTSDAFLDKSKMHVIVLDPGHDAYKPGASGGGMHEEKLTLKIAQYCRQELQRYGVTVYMTRETGACPGGRLNSRDCLNWRVNYAASKGAEYLVSLHLNASGANAHGCEVLRQNTHYNVNNIYAKSKNLSENILAELHGIGIPNWGVGFEEKDSNGSDPSYYPDGNLADYYAILRHGKEKGIPSVIVEHCFISNAGDRSNYLSSEAKLKQLGVADAHGILKTLGLM